MATVQRAHEWQAVSRKGVRSQRCKRCGIERLNASPVCYVEETTGPETPDADVLSPDVP